MPDLAQYFQQKLIGGPGAFVMTAYDYTDFARAIREKLSREMTTTPVAQRKPFGKGEILFALQNQ